jgi:hypothetical protein
MTDAIPETVVPSSRVVSTIGIPATRPRIREIPMIEINGWILNLEIAMIIKTTATTNAIISGKPVIEKPPSLNRLSKNQ